MKGVQSKLKFNNDNMEELDIYPGVELSKMDNNSRDKCWDMSSENYCNAMVNNFDTTLDKK